MRPRPGLDLDLVDLVDLDGRGAVDLLDIDLDLDLGVVGVARLLGRTRRHLLAQLTTVAAVATTTLALGHLPDAVGQERHLAARRIAFATCRCCWVELPVTRRARIFARSDMNRRNRLTSL